MKGYDDNSAKRTRENEAEELKNNQGEFCPSRIKYTCTGFPVASIPRIASTAVRAYCVVTKRVRVTIGRESSTFIDICKNNDNNNNSMLLNNI